MTKPAPELIHLTLVATNDLHGWVHPQEFTVNGGAPAAEGGLATFAGYVEILRRRNPDGVLLLDGGDLFQGTLPSNLTEGAVVIDAMNALGYAGAALGNHEFDYGPVGAAPVPVAEGDDPFGALKARIQQARFPILAANVVDAATGKPPAWLGNDGTRLVERGGLKIGLVGLATPTTPNVTNPVNVASLRFTDPVRAAERAAASLRARGATVVIGLAHMGGKCTDLADPHDVSSCEPRNGEIFGVLERMKPGTLDAVVAGHTHQAMGHFVHGVPVVETWGLGRNFGVVELFVDPATGAVVREKTRITPVVPICERVDEKLRTCDARKLRGKEGVTLVAATFLGEPVETDAKLAALIAPAQQAAEELQRKPLGVTVEKTLTRKYDAESPLGGALTDALRAAEKADVALMNPGGLRADLRAGELRFGDVYEVLPFDNTIATITLDGEQLTRLLAAAYGGRRGVFQVSGVRVQLSRCLGPGRLKGVTLDSGKPPRPDQKYRVVMPDFLARADDGLEQAFEELPPGAVDLGEARPETVRDAIVAHWSAQKVVRPPAPGRVTFVDDGSSCGGEKAPAAR